MPSSIAHSRELWLGGRLNARFAVSGCKHQRRIEDFEYLVGLKLDDLFMTGWGALYPKSIGERLLHQVSVDILRNYVYVKVYLTCQQNPKVFRQWPL